MVGGLFDLTMLTQIRCKQISGRIEVGPNFVFSSWSLVGSNERMQFYFWTKCENCVGVCVPQMPHIVDKAIFGAEPAWLRGPGPYLDADITGGWPQDNHRVGRWGAISVSWLSKIFLKMRMSSSSTVLSLWQMVTNIGSICSYQYQFTSQILVWVGGRGWRGW